MGEFRVQGSGFSGAGEGGRARTAAHRGEPFKISNNVFRGNWRNDRQIETGRSQPYPNYLPAASLTRTGLSAMTKYSIFCGHVILALICVEGPHHLVAAEPAKIASALQPYVERQ